MSHSMVTENPLQTKEWCRNLGYPTWEKTTQTLQNIMHHIKTLEGKTLEYMRDYHKTHVNALRHRRLNDTLLVD